jgi:hypothetical protein
MMNHRIAGRTKTPAPFLNAGPLPACLRHHFAAILESPEQHSKSLI